MPARSPRFKSSLRAASQRLIRRDTSLKDDVVEAITLAISESDFSPARCCRNALL